jgi:hypothetical protein
MHGDDGGGVVDEANDDKDEDAEADDDDDQRPSSPVTDPVTSASQHTRSSFAATLFAVAATRLSPFGVVAAWRGGGAAPSALEKKCRHVIACRGGHVRSKTATGYRSSWSLIVTYAPEIIVERSVSNESFIIYTLYKAIESRVLHCFDDARHGAAPFCERVSKKKITRRWMNTPI